MKTAWFFGDSFVYGWGCRDRTNDKDKIMSQIVTEHLNCKEKNLAQYGYSNENILFSILTNINKVKKGDYLFIFDTHSARSSFVREESDFYSNWPKSSYIKIRERYSDNYYAMRAEYEEPLKRYYQTTFNCLVKYLNSNEIDSYYFPSDNNWWALNKIDMQEEEDGGHWSFEGHQKVSKWVTDLIENKNYSLI